MVKRSVVLASVTSVLVLGGCVILPTAPTVAALPGSRTGFEQFRADDDACRNYAYAAVGGAGQVAMNNAAANAAVGTALGAAAGAIIGSASGQAGAGAAIGAGTGLLFGSVAGADYAGYSSYQLQRRYDVTYAQCMYARGNRVPAQFVYRGPPRRYAPAYAPYYRLPDDAPPDYRPPDYAPPNYPPPRG
jgi:hypothetical protein